MPAPFTPAAGQLGNLAGALSNATEPDSELLRLCSEYLSVEAASRRLNRLADLDPDEADPAKLEAAAEAEGELDKLDEAGLLQKIAGIRAATMDGLQAKAKAVFAFFSPDPPEYESLAGPALWSLICELAGEDAAVAKPEPDIDPLAESGPAVPAARYRNPDQELIEACEEHIANMRAIETAPPQWDGADDNDPLMQVYLRTHEVIETAQPQTIFGIVAKARAAHAEANGGIDYDGNNNFYDGEKNRVEGPGTQWAWDVMQDLMRLFVGRTIAA